MRAKPFINILFILFLVLLLKCHAAAQEKETTLLITKTARGGCEKEYFWSVQKSVSPQTLEMRRGESQEVEFTVHVTRSGSQDKYWVEGEIILTNGSVSSEGLQIIERVQYKGVSGNFSDLPNAAIIYTTLPEEQLKPHEARRIPYRLAFVPVNGATAYRTISNVTITNYVEHMYERYGPEMIIDFQLPPNQLIVNESINVDDSNGYSWGFSDSGTWTYKKSFTCDQDTGTHVSTAVIRETGLSDSAVITVICLAETVSPQTIDYWKNHPQEIASLLPIELGNKGKESIQVINYAQALDILNMNTFGSPHNLITTLYAQMLAAKLNMKNSLSRSPLTKKVIEEADAFICENSYRSWKNLNNEQKNMVNYWVNQLDNYNNDNL